MPSLGATARAMLTSATPAEAMPVRRLALSAELRRSLLGPSRRPEPVPARPALRADIRRALLSLSLPAPPSARIEPVVLGAPTVEVGERAERPTPSSRARLTVDAAAVLAPPAESVPETAPALLSAELPMELQTPAARTKANLAAMHLAAELKRSPRELTDDDRRVLGAYSGWGGLSLHAAAGRFPRDFPQPEERGLIHEYYTPSRVTAEVARVVAPLLPALARDGLVEALEPSAGIGRFVRAFEGTGFELVRWHAVEYSAVSAAMLRA